MASQTSAFADGGHMGACMRAYDWSSTTLGPQQHWPPSLLTLVRVMLNSRQPMFIAWGADRTLLYNDTYAPMLGERHPAALGRPFRDVFSDVWTHVEPMVERALAGEATWSENMPFEIDRRGYAEKASFTFSYSPLRDDADRIVGMFCACTETTAQVLAERHRDAVMRLEECLRDLPALLEELIAFDRLAKRRYA